VHILLIEDDTEAAKFLVKGLRESGHAVDHAADGREGLFRATEGQFDLVVTDRMLPHIDGLAIIQLMRQKGITTPVLVLSALGTVDDRVRGLKAGGDDYLTKPFAFSELLARVRALLRRRVAADSPVLEADDIVIDTSRRAASRGGRALDLSPKELMVLEYLVRHAGLAVTRDMIGEAVWGKDYNAMSNIVEVFINRLRQKIEIVNQPPLIVTVRGAGYMLRLDLPVRNSKSRGSD